MEKICLTDLFDIRTIQQLQKDAADALEVTI